MSEMLMEDYIREQINKGQYGVIVIPISTAEDIAYYIETSRDKTEPVRHAKIVNIPFGDSTYEGCSLCGADYNRYYSHGNYCSYCGAKFEEVTE